MGRSSKNVLNVTAGVLLLLIQAFASVAAVYQAVRSNMLPVLYLTVAIVVLILLEVLTGFVYFHTFGKKGRGSQEEKNGIGHCLIAAALTLLITALCLIGTNVLSIANTTVDKISGQAVQGSKIAVYVLKDSPAESIQDLKDASFSLTNSYDSDKVWAAVDDINATIGSTIQTQIYDSVYTMIDTLRSGEVDAIILNEAYSGLLEEQEEYATFADETRIVYEYEIKEEVKEAEEENDKDVNDPFILYISGSDTRSTKLVTSRSDVNLLAVVNPSSRQILLINTPRDYYVNTAVSGGTKDKLTHAGIYGIQCSMDTLGALYDEKVDHYVQVNFTGFEKLIDAIGGITVDVDQTFTNKNGGNYSFQKGPTQMDGSKALAYVRERYALADGDNGRGRHQMQVISAIVSKISSGNTIVTKYADIMDSMQGTFATDMSSDAIGELVKMQLSDTGKWNVKSYAVTGTGASNVTYSMPGRKLYVMIPNQATVDHAKELIDKVYAGDTITDEDLKVQ